MDDIFITVFGTWWCEDCSRIRKILDRNHIIYHWVDIDRDERGEQFVLSTNRGMRSVPTILFEDGSILVEPTDMEMRHRLEQILKSSSLLILNCSIVPLIPDHERTYQ